ncbi:MAG: hypothetical protein EBT97_10130 [Actinobacteria bacterium]|nr:hypothetical protein [Actinomycetota bacterium]
MNQFLILLSHRNAANGKYRCFVLRKRPKRVAAGNALVIDLTTTPPCVVAADPKISYPFYSKHLPDQFVDHEGSLRNKTGAVVFPAPNLPDRQHVEEPTNHPFTRNNLGAWIKGGPSTVQIYPSNTKTPTSWQDMADMLALHVPETPPAVYIRP